ncbi:hypothetical protein AQJ11_40375 [Streptomyces corchorusii]|uniref:Uncharacterized protein n=2 Tax=Streptomyces TaxID=1883 RepID=A0A101PRA3_STRCK|nr:hypothetical protein [Streptomyces corchorusii]KUN16246.1 hypothetical protein AQJ11_40375 [Streptomyces corchorusii]
MATEDPYAIWPYHLHCAIRTALRSADDHAEDRWTSADWHRAAERALAAPAQLLERHYEHRRVQALATLAANPHTPYTAVADVPAGTCGSTQNGLGED